MFGRQFGAFTGPVNWSSRVCAGMVAVVLVGAIAGGSAAAPVPADPPGRTLLVGTNLEVNENAAVTLSDDGRTAAYQSRPVDSSDWRIYRRSLLGGDAQFITSTVPAGAQAVAPSMDAAGSRVAYAVEYGGSPPGYNRFFVDETPITGTAADLTWQRTGPCDIADESPCGPRLSGDGRTAVYPVSESISSPHLVPEIDDDPLADNDHNYLPLYDFGLAYYSTVTTITVQIAAPGVTFTGSPVVDGRRFQVVPNSSVEDSTPECLGAFPAGAHCDIAVRYSPPFCTSPRTDYGTLRTVAATPAGRTALALVGDGCIGSGTNAPTNPDPGPPPQCAESGGPPAVPSVPQNGPLTDPVGVFGEVPAHSVVRRSFLVTNASPESTATLGFSTAGCALSLDESVADPTTCRFGQHLGPSASCLAYVRFEPDGVAPYAATLTLTSAAAGRRIIRFAGSGTRDLVLSRRDTTGDGTFAGAPAIVSTAGSTAIDGSQPAVSTDGRLVAFTSHCAATALDCGGASRVYLRDTRAGTTRLVSILPTGAAAGTADQPSLSGDGNRVAFVAAGPPGQVYVRDLAAARTVLASAGPTGPASTGADSPALSRDGSTLAYVSTALNLVDPPPTDPGSRVYARDLGPDFAPGDAGGPARGNEQVSVGEADGPVDGAASQRPAIDGAGGVIGFDSASPLLGNDQAGIAAYARERFPHLAVAPLHVDFPPTPVGATSQPLPVTISNGGPGPVVLDLAVTGPYTIVGTPCVTVHRGESCSVTLAAAPVATGPQAGALLVGGSAGTGTLDPVRVTLGGVATAPILAIAPDPIAFPPQGLGVASRPVTVTVTNTGPNPLRIAAAFSPPDRGFAVRRTTCTGVLAPAARCTALTTYTPAVLAKRTADLVVTVTDPQLVTVDQAVPATGSTIAPTLNAEPAVLVAGRVASLAGEHFPPGQPVTIGWRPGIGEVTAVPDGGGHLEAQLVTLKYDIAGSREPVAALPDLGVEVVGPPVLVVPGSYQPPDFSYRG